MSWARLIGPRSLMLSPVMHASGPLANAPLARLDDQAVSPELLCGSIHLSPGLPLFPRNTSATHFGEANPPPKARRTSRVPHLAHREESQSGAPPFWRPSFHWGVPFRNLVGCGLLPGDWLHTHKRTPALSFWRGTGRGFNVNLNEDIIIISLPIGNVCSTQVRIIHQKKPFAFECSTSAILMRIAYSLPPWLSKPCEKHDLALE